MEFMNRGNRPNTPQTGAPAAAPIAPAPTNNASRGFMGLKLASVALLFSVTILLVALLWFVVLGSPSSEGKHVNEDRLQAVFLNSGQVYFGKIKEMNNDFVRIQDIFYLRVDQQVQPDQEGGQAQGTPVLVPLGCELHRPQNEMLINREQVSYWENLKNDDAENSVPGAIKKYKADNPNGQQCQTSQNNADADASNEEATEETDEEN